jgi:hypothetical protein
VYYPSLRRSFCHLDDAAFRTVCDITPHYTHCLTPPPSTLNRKEYVFFRDFLKNIRLAYLKIKLPLVGNKCSFIYLATVYEEKKVVMLHFLQSICSADGTFPDDLMGRMKEFCEGNPDLKAATKVRRQCCVVRLSISAVTSPTLLMPLGYFDLFLFLFCIPRPLYSVKIILPLPIPS